MRKRGDLLMEVLDLYDEYGNKTGEKTERGKPIPKDRYFLIVDVWIRNSKKEYLISKRTPNTQPDPNKWQPTCGCAIEGDDSIAAAVREVREELGISLDPKCGKRIIRFTAWGTAIIDVWIFEKEVCLCDIVYQAGETDDAMWAKSEEIIQLLENDKFLSVERIPYVRELERV